MSTTPATPVTELELPKFDPTDPLMRGQRFHEAMSELRAKGWLAEGPFGYVVLDRESAEFFLRTRSAIFPGMKIAEIFGVTEGPLYEQMRRNILHVNGPDHTRLRSLVNPALSPRAVERYRPMMREFLEQLLAQVLAEGADAKGSAAGADDPGGPDGSRAASGSGGAGGRHRCEFVQAFAKPYPSMAIAAVMGAPLEDAPRLHHWSNWIQRQFDAVSMSSEQEQIEEAVKEFYEYAEALVKARRRDPADDLISKLIAATVDGNGQQGDRLSDVECINLVFNVLVGGVDTSQSQLAHTIRLLAEHPDQLELLAADPSLAEAAVEEGLRYEPITPFTARITTEDVVWRDVTFAEGTVVIVCAFTGNRDLNGGAAGAEGVAAGADGSAAGADAERFDITADRGRARPLTFGAGVHYCLGANLARVELQEGLAFLSQRLGDLRLEGDPVYEGVSGIYGLAELPISFTA
ncbi:MAG: cytochrome P450 [Actinobacteria bacterium]|nr:MAG: cytochrome P450 [Actinomycetota bacterium]